MVWRPFVVVQNFKHEYLCHQCADHNEINKKHHWNGGKAALDFGPDRIKTLVSMATYSSHRVIIEKTVLPLFSAIFHPILFILACNDDMHGRYEEFEIRPAPITKCGVSCPWASEKILILIMGKRVANFSWLSFIGSISYLQVTRTYTRAWMSLKFGQIRRLVSMATDRIIMAKTVLPPFLGCFYPIFSYLHVIMTCMRAWRSSKFVQIRLLTAELHVAALEKIPIDL